MSVCYLMSVFQTLHDLSHNNNTYHLLLL